MSQKHNVYTCIMFIIMCGAHIATVIHKNISNGKLAMDVYDVDVCVPSHVQTKDAHREFTYICRCWCCFDGVFAFIIVQRNGIKTNASWRREMHVDLSQVWRDETTPTVRQQCAWLGRIDECMETSPKSEFFGSFSFWLSLMLSLPMHFYMLSREEKVRAILLPIAIVISQKTWGQRGIRHGKQARHAQTSTQTSRVQFNIIILSSHC